MTENFDTWLSTRLQELKTDDAVFGPYIKSILEGDEDLEEKIEGLDELLMALGGNFDAESLRNEILKRWDEANNLSGACSDKGDGLSTSALVTPPSNSSVDSVDQQLFDRLLTITSDSILSSSDQASSSASNKELTTNRPDPALRAAILSNYRADDSESDEDDDAVKSTKKKAGNEDEISKNVNSERVLNEQREVKEKAKQDAAKKREKDREDRTKQKQAAQDRKDKAKKKATKVERKR